MSAIQVHVNYAAISRNVETLRAAAPTAELMAVVKADAYGHGLIEASRAAREGGAAWLGTAQPGEALALRSADDAGHIVTWLYGPEVPARALIEAGVDVAASSLEVLAAIVSAASAAGAPARLHVCVDTGLGREGVQPAQLDTLLDAVTAARDAGHVVPVGIWSHFAWADSPGHPTIDAQSAAFTAATEAAAAHGVEFEHRHLANSAATLTRPQDHHTLVRPGLAVYGLSPVEDPAGHAFGLVPAMSVTSALALVKSVPAGHGVSYGHEYVTDRETVLGLVPAGYADGVFRHAGNRAPVRVGDQVVKIAGRVCMDQFVVDLGPESSARAGDEVVLFGSGGPTAHDWADAAETIDYEVVTRFGGLRPKTGA